MQNYQMYIGGGWSAASSGQWLDTVNPYTGEAWARIPRANADDVNAAVSAAHAAFAGEWSSFKPSQRGRLLMTLADLIENDAEHLANIEVRDNGKLYAEMFAQTKYLAQWYRYYGGLADKIEGAVIPTDKPDTFNFTRYEPLGVVAMITPWNSPLLLLTRSSPPRSPPATSRSSSPRNTRRPRRWNSCRFSKSGISAAVWSTS